MDLDCNLRSDLPTLVAIELFRSQHDINAGEGGWAVYRHPAKIQADWWLNKVVARIEEIKSVWYSKSLSRYNGIPEGQIKVYMSDTSIPNVFSPFHLAIQALLADLV